VPSTLYRNGVVHSPTDPFAEALLVADGQVAWLGSEDTVHTVLDGVDEVIELDGALVTPAFVDAHAHVLETGFALTGLDLSPAAGVTSLDALLDAVGAAATRARAAGASAPLLGRGWDETGWSEGRGPTAAELDRATGGAPVHLLRGDGAGAVVSGSFAEVAGCAGLPGWSPDGNVTGEAARAAHRAAHDVGGSARDELVEVALRAAAASGIASIHEHSSALLDTVEGLARLLALTADPASGLPGVVGYRAEACETTDDVRRLLEAAPGLTGVIGKVDGSLAARGAALRSPYADLPRDHPSATGRLDLTAEEVANHVAAVSRAGLQAVLHVTGDRAMDEALLGVRAACDVESAAGVRGGGHRVEHADMVDAQALATLVLLGLNVGVQPALGAALGGAGGLYGRRLGAGRAAALSPLADLAGAGVPLAFGSGAPVTPFDPWAAVLAAISHQDPGQRISARAAFRAHTRGGWRAAGIHTGAGEIRLGAPATLAVWEAESLAVQAPDGRLAAWSTDPRAGTPLLPELGAGRPRPVCRRTLRDGVVLFDTFV
jgi:predicted amidohydrolase YtcJ